MEDINLYAEGNSERIELIGKEIRIIDKSKSHSEIPLLTKIILLENIKSIKLKKSGFPGKA